MTWRLPYDWNRPAAGRASPVERGEVEAAFWRGFAFGVPVALALWLAAAFLVVLLVS